MADNRLNSLGQPIGAPLPDWQGAARPPREPIEGRYLRMEPLDPEAHLEDLFEAFAEDGEGRLWTYMTAGPFASSVDMGRWLDEAAATDDPLFHTLIDRASGRAVGLAAYLRIDPANGVIEIGSISFAPAMQGTRLGTEAMYLFMRRAFDELGYRRYEWKCDALNAASRRAAERLGFGYDGLFRQAVVYKGRNRDTAWYSILDSDWPRLKAAYETWLDEANFDERGRQRQDLRDLIASARGD